MCFKQLKIRKLLFVLGMLAIVFASEAQNKKFQLVLNSAIDIFNDKRDYLGEFAPKGIYELEFEYNNGLTITSPRLGGDLLEMSNNLIYAEEWASGDFVCTLYDGDSYNGHDFTKCFTYSKGKLSMLQIAVSNRRLNMGGLGIVFVDETKTTNICSTTVENDPLIKFMRSISNKKQSPKNNNTSTKSSTAPKYGKVELPGYVYEREGYDSVVNEDANGILRVETTQTHYIEIRFGCRERWLATNLAQTSKYRTNWSTRKGVIKISLPAGVTIGNNDEIICWECNSDPNNPYTDHPSRGAVMFVYSPSTGKLQCVKTYESKWGSHIVEDMYYFVTTDASAWSKIKPMLLYNLPFCGNRIN